MTKPLNPIEKQIRLARRQLRRLAKAFPSAFDTDGRPIVATLRWPGPR